MRRFASSTPASLAASLLAAALFATPGTALADSSPSGTEGEAEKKPDIVEIGEEEVTALDHEHLSALSQYGASPLALDRFPDFAIARPTVFALAVLSTATYAIAAPINAIVSPGTNRELARGMVVDPYLWVFTRPLGAAADSLDPDDE